MFILKRGSSLPFKRFARVSPRSMKKVATPPLKYPSLSYYHNLKQNTTEWLQAREEFLLTASQMGQALGLCPYRTARSLLQSKRTKTPSKQLFSPYQERIIKWGRDHERDAVAAFERATGLKTLETGLYPIQVLTAVDPDCPDGDLLEEFPFAASPDRLIVSEEDASVTATLEVKCPWKQEIYPGLRNKTRPSIPSDHYVQVQAQMKAVQVDQSFYVCWTPKETVIVRINFDPVIWKKIEQLLLDFVTLLKKNEVEEIEEKTSTVGYTSAVMRRTKNKILPMVLESMKARVNHIPTRMLVVQPPPTPQTMTTTTTSTATSTTQNSKHSLSPSSREYVQDTSDKRVRI